MVWSTLNAPQVVRWSKPHLLEWLKLNVDASSIRTLRRWVLNYYIELESDTLQIIQEIRSTSLKHFSSFIIKEIVNVFHHIIWVCLLLNCVTHALVREPVFMPNHVALFSSAPRSWGLIWFINELYFFLFQKLKKRWLLMLNYIYSLQATIIIHTYQFYFILFYFSDLFFIRLNLHSSVFILSSSWTSILSFTTRGIKKRYSNSNIGSEKRWHLL